MKPRRSRFARIYHHLTRRVPNHDAQWKEIGKLRPYGSLGHPAGASSKAHAYVREEPADEHIYERPAEIPLREAAYLARPMPAPRAQQELSPGGGVAVGALAVSLFVLACAYAALSGYMHSYDDGFAYFGILGAIGSLLAAGIGICLAAAARYRRYSGRFLTICVISLAALYGLLVFLAAGH